MFVALVLLSSSIAANIEPIELVRDGHAQGREAIRSLSVKVEAVTQFRADSSRPPIRAAGEWWQDGLNYRGWEETFQPAAPNQRIGSMRFDRLFLDSRAKVLLQDSASGDVKQVRGWLGKPSMLGAAMSPWSWGLFELRTSDQLQVIGALRDPSKFVERVESEERNGKKFFRVEFRPFGDTRITVWIDPSVNYLVRRMMLDIPKSDSRIEREVREFREGPPGVFFPTRIHVSDNYKGKLMSETNVIASELRINQAIDPGKFRLTFPKGTFVVDQTKGIEYLAESDEVPDPVAAPRPIPPETPEHIQYATGQGPEKPFSWQRIVAWSSLAIAGAAATLWLFVRGRNRALGG